jgi:Family of unknown function (DUF6152)
MYAKFARLFMIVGIFLVAAPLFAHHSFSAEFDINQRVTLHGTLTKLEWMNPHSWIYIDVKGDDGKVVNWAIETGGPNTLLRRGVRKTDFRLGLELVIKGYRAKNGTNTADGRSITFPDGKKLFGGTPGDGGPEDVDAPATPAQK